MYTLNRRAIENGAYSHLTGFIGFETLGQADAYERSHAGLLAALEDAEFLLRKAGQLTGPMQDSFNRSAADARAVIAKAKGQ